MRDDLPRQLIDGPAVIVGGPAALALAAFLRRYQREWREHAAPFAAASIEVATTIEALGRCAAAFKRSQVPNPEANQLPSAEVGLPSRPMVTPEIAAGRLGCSERWIRHLLSDGRLPGAKVAGRWMVDAESLEK